MMRIGLVALALGVAACASGDVGSDFDAGGNVADADPNAPDANANVPDASGDTPDAAAGTPDAEPPPPDADPTMPPTVLVVTPPTAGTFGGEDVVVTGNNFSSDVAISFGATAATCSFVSSTTVDCTVPAAGSAGYVGVTATQTSGTHTLTDGFLYWDTASAVDACNLAPPTHADGIQGVSFTWQARVNEAGITDATTGVDVSGTLLGQIGYGPAGTNPATTPGWTWFDVSPVGGYGPASPIYTANYDGYEVAEPMPTRAQYAWSARFSIEAGVSWRFCGTGTMTSRLPIGCTADALCFSDEKCIDDTCRVVCDTAADCYPWGAHCSGLGFETDDTTFALYCDPGVSGGDPTGTTCTSGATCESGFCLVDLTDTCTAGCDSDALCPSGDVCTEYSDLGLCSPSCGATSNCAAGHECIFNRNNALNRYDQLCLVPAAGGDPFGAFCDATTNNCASGLCILGPDACTVPCNGAGDCGGVLPTCGGIGLTRPNGVGTQTVQVCLP